MHGYIALTPERKGARFHVRTKPHKKDAHFAQAGALTPTHHGTGVK